MVTVPGPRPKKQVGEKWAPRSCVPQVSLEASQDARAKRHGCGTWCVCMSVLGARPSAPAALPDPLPKALLLWASLTPHSLGGGSAVGKGHSLHGVLSGSQQHEDTQDASVGQWPSAPLAGKPGE